MKPRIISFGLALLIGLVAQVRGQQLQNITESRRDCAVCHTEWSTDFDKPGAVLLMDKPQISMASQETTCLGCHDGSVRDSRKKVWQEQSHKTGVTPPASMQVPAGLPLDNGKLACRTCHTAHNVPGAEDMSSTFFLRVNNDQSQLCQLCHSEKSAGPTHGSHPVGPMAIPTPANLVAAGAKTGPKGQELICQSCHGAHGSKADKLLVLSASDNALCVSCHEKLRPGQWGEAAGHTHPVNAPLSTDAQRQAVRDMGTHTGPQDTLACLSCHRLHDSPAKSNLLADVLTDSKLCLRCHANKATVASTPHDLRKTAPTTRNSLGQTADDSGPCSACHTPHQSAQPPLVAQGDPTGQCETCHADGRIAKTSGPTHLNHPSSVDRDKLPAGLTLAVASEANNPDRADLACTTCHDPHDPTQGRFLREKPDQLCASCHVDQAATLAGSHDFTNRPTAKNGLGQTVQDSGKCGFCHNVHKGAGPDIWIATAAAPDKAADMCVSCHNATGLASDHPAPAFSHPTGVASPATRPSAVPLPLFDAAGQRAQTDGLVQCASCHNPHADSTKSTLMLRVLGSTSDLCLKCHAEKSTLYGSIHDSVTNPAWASQNAAAGAAPDGGADVKKNPAANDLCMSCHRAHGNDPAKKLWAVTPAAGVTPADGVCIACHQKNAWAGDTDATPAIGAMLHPQSIPTTRDSSGEHADVTAAVAAYATPLVPAPGSTERTQIGCETCHNPHAAKTVPALLRSPDPAQPQEVCFQCHKSESNLDHSMHAAGVMAKSPANADPDSPAKPRLLCAPCHAVHAVQGSQREKLWAVKTDATAVTTNEQRCLGCHDNNTAPRPQIPTHPQVAFGLLTWSATQPADLPKYLPTDKSIPGGVCHLPHGNGNTSAIPLPASTTQPSPDALIALRNATKPMIRLSVAKDQCATCHGNDAERVFLYYHHPDQRKDVKALQDPTGALNMEQ